MSACAQVLAAQLQQGDCLLLSGTLGVGKTTFARAVVRALCGADTEVVSPTFMLVQEYDASAGFSLMHFDLYRLQQPEELWELGLDEVMGHALLLVEWPEIAQDYWPQNRLELHIEHSDADNDARRLQLTAHGSMVAVIERFIAQWENMPND